MSSEAARVFGFTGTSKGMTSLQAEMFAQLLALRGDRPGDKFFHGLCVGADEQAHLIAAALGMKTIGAPGREVGDPMRSRVRCDVTFAVRKELVRNRLIAGKSTLLFACPRNQEGEILRSGTWATVRYARREGTPVIVIRPNGAVDLSGGTPASVSPDRPPWPVPRTQRRKS